MIEDKREGNKAATPVTVVKKTSTMGPIHPARRRSFSRETIHA
jgi:hypothetical protein